MYSFANHEQTIVVRAEDGAFLLWDAENKCPRTGGYDREKWELDGSPQPSPWQEPAANE